MGHEFDTRYWDEHWRATPESDRATTPPHPALVREVADVTPGTALDAGSGEGAEALWLARRGWDVTAVDVSPTVIARAAARDPDARVRWVEADLTTWWPDRPFDLVAAHYVHPTLAPTAFYARLAEWVAPGGTLLVVAHRGGHGPSGGHAGHGAADHGDPPAEASVALADVTAALDPGAWDVVTAAEPDRTLTRHGHDVVLRDVVVRATRTHPTEQDRTEP